MDLPVNFWHRDGILLAVFVVYKKQETRLKTFGIQVAYSKPIQ